VDLGMAGRWATICGSSHGVGRSCAEALAAEGVNVVVNGFESAAVEQAAAEISAVHGVDVRPVTADLTTQAGRDRLLAACADPDILVTSNALLEPDGLPEATDDFAAAMRMHYLERHYWAPVALVQEVISGMRARRFGRIVNITSAKGPALRPTPALSTGGQAGMSVVMKGLAMRAAEDNVTINQLVTGRGPAPAVPSRGRVRHWEELGAACAILCSVHAAHISGIDLYLGSGYRSLALVG
jgi:3-oxoacyl-[acyl-carrier protein] reductase